MTTRLNGAARTFAAMLVGGAAVGAFVFAPQATHRADAQKITMEPPGGAPTTFADLIEQVSPAVVSVNVVGEPVARGRLEDLEQFFDQFRGLPGFEEFRRRQEENEDEGQPSRSLGSGFFISADGLAVTNNHVVRGAREIQVQLNDGEEYDAEIVGVDPETDLAVIRVDGEGEQFPYVEFSQDTEVRVGDWVVAVGNPFGLGGTATAGIISADGRRIGNDNPYTDFLQIDAPINRGNSGGPTFDLNGRVIGVNTAIFSPTGGSVGIGFAIPADLAVRVTEQLITNGKVVRGWLGVSIQDVTDEMVEALGLASSNGAIVADLVGENSPAAKSGVRRGDIIVEINGDEVRNASDATRKVGSLLANTENEFVVVRDGERRAINVTVGVRQEDANAAPVLSGRRDGEPDAGEEFGLGVELSSLDEATRDALGLGADEPAVLITDLAPDSPLRETTPQTIRPGAAILEANGREIGSGEDFANAIQEAERQGKTKVLLAVRMGPRTIYTTVDLEGASE